MQKNAFLCLFLLILSACESVRFKFPPTSKRLISVERADSGEITSVACIFTPSDPKLPTEILPIEECDGTIGTSIEEYEKLSEFFTDKIKRLEICINARKKCR